MFQIGDKLRLKRTNKDYGAQPGALAQYIGLNTTPGMINIIWNRNDIRCGNQQNGGYSSDSFELATTSKLASLELTDTLTPRFVAIAIELEKE